MNKNTLISYETFVTQQVKKVVQSIAPKSEIILFGSRARKTASEDSDWDFLILLPSDVEPNIKRKIKDLLYEIELETNSVISCIIRTKEEWHSKKFMNVPLRREIKRDGITL